MKAEETLQFMTDFSPYLFPTRKHCLEHLFCAVGNGYNWVDGELVYNNNADKRNRYMLKQPIEKAIFDTEESWNIAHNFYKKAYENKEIRRIPFQYDFSWYPLNKEYSYLFNYPDDIKPDWKALLEECKQIMINDGININI